MKNRDGSERNSTGDPGDAERDNMTDDSHLVLGA